MAAAKHRTAQASSARIDRQIDPPAMSGSHQDLMARLYREHNQALIGFLMTRVDTEQEARDVAQEAYVRLLQLDARGAVSFLCAYLFKTAGNIAIDRVRRKALTRQTDHALLPEQRMAPMPDPARVLEERDRLQVIGRLLEELPLKCRQAFYLHRVHDLSPPDIAARLGIRKRMVHKHLVRAMTHLRARLEAMDER